MVETLINQMSYPIQRHLDHPVIPSKSLMLPTKIGNEPEKLFDADVDFVETLTIGIVSEVGIDTAGVVAF